MADFTWHNFFEIGVDFIDDDHKNLLIIIQDVRNAIDANEHNKCITLLNKLITEARNHFKREEQYLEEVKYPELEEHKKYHNDLLERADTTRRICEDIEYEHDLNKCFDGIAKFLVDDIFNGDIKFKSHLEFYGHIKKK